MARLVISVWRSVSQVKCVIYILYQGVETSAAALCLYAWLAITFLHLLNRHLLSGMSSDRKAALDTLHNPSPGHHSLMINYNPSNYFSMFGLILSGRGEVQLYPARPHQQLVASQPTSALICGRMEGLTGLFKYWTFLLQYFFILNRSRPSSR